MNEWIKVCSTKDILENGGSCVKVLDEQIAIFNFNYNQWYAVQNMCPHKKQFVLSRGLIGEDEGEPKIACPLHKNLFSLKTGKHLQGNSEYQLKTYPIRIQDDEILINLIK
jgi:nitrite reductase (NADH) small subunit